MGPLRTRRKTVNIRRPRHIAATGVTIVAIIFGAYGMFSINAVLYFVLAAIFFGVSMLLFGFPFLQEPNGDRG
jgi:hypothetical protein